MAYKYSMIAQLEGNTLDDLIVGCDAIAASLERKEKSRSAEAPDKSGRYSYSANDDKPLVEFGRVERIVREHGTFKKRVRELQEEVDTLKGTPPEPNDSPPENESYINGGDEKPKPKKRSKRGMRAY